MEVKITYVVEKQKTRYCEKKRDTRTGNEIGEKVLYQYRDAMGRKFSEIDLVMAQKTV